MNSVRVIIFNREGKKRFDYTIDGCRIYSCEDEPINGHYMVGVDNDEHFFEIDPFDICLFMCNGYAHVGPVLFKDYYDENHRIIKVKSIFAS